MMPQMRFKSRVTRVGVPSLDFSYDCTGASRIQAASPGNPSQESGPTS